MPKLKNVGVLRDLVRGQGAARHLDHRAEDVFGLDPGGLLDRLRLGLEDVLGRLELVHVADQRDHDLGLRVAARRLDGDQRVEDRPGLDLHEVRDHQPQAAAAQPEHRVLLVQALDRGQQLAVLLGRAAGRLGPGDLDQLVLEVRQELVERRVDAAG